MPPASRSTSNSSRSSCAASSAPPTQRASPRCSESLEDTMTKRIFDRIRAIDTDTHITEPPDVWTARVSTKRWGDAVPHVRKHEGRDVWFIRDQPAGAPGFVSMAGFDGSLPDGPRGYADIPASAYDSSQRLAHMDAEGIYAQVLYPNGGGFGSGGFLKLQEAQVMLECV